MDDQVILFNNLGELWDVLVRNLDEDVNIMGFRWLSGRKNNTRLGAWQIMLNRDPEDDRHVWMPCVHRTEENETWMIIKPEDLMQLEAWHHQETIGL